MARTVLLADDSVTAQNMGRRILIDAGYEVITVNNGSAALKKVHENRPDLIVLDVYMPGYGGLEVCQRLKEAEETAKIPILLTVGKMEPFKTDEAKRARADAHIVKPFDAGELLAVLTKLEDRIVPQSEPSRGRKTKSEKSEKKSKASRAFDPAMSFDDSHSEKIAYLEQVKQRTANAGRSEDSGTDVEDWQEESHNKQKRNSEGPPMPRPMGVYAAEALREMPVVAEPPAEDSDPQQQTASDESSVSDQVASSISSGTQQTGSVSDGASAEPAQSTPETQGAAPWVDPAQMELPTAEAEPEVAASSDAQAAESISEPVREEADSVRAEDEPTEPESAARDQESSSQPVTAVSRWVAENVAVTPEEAALELEREMNQMHAAKAAMEAIQADDVARQPASFSAEAQSPENGTSPQNAEAAGFQPATSEPADDNSATFAAAAASSSSSVSAVSSRATDAEGVPSETAAAWENWQHIRDSVMGSQTAISLSETVVEAVKSSVEASIPAEANVESVPETSQADAPEPVSQSSQPAGESDDAAVLSSIVDSVLAELKPRLMQEISKKLKK